MPLKVTFELSDNDLRYFRKTLADVTSRASDIASDDLIASATATLEELPTDAPQFVLERTAKLRAMIEMVNDQDWRLEGKDRERVVRALSYFADPSDLIPDAIPGIGFLDDAIMIELVVQDLEHELDAYADFCRLREKKKLVLKSGHTGPTHREEWLEARRIQLQARMQRRRRRRSAASRSSRAGSRKSSLSLW